MSKIPIISFKQKGFSEGLEVGKAYLDELKEEDLMVWFLNRFALFT